MRFKDFNDDQSDLINAIFPSQRVYEAVQPVRGTTESHPNDRDITPLPVSRSKFPCRGSRYPLQTISLKTVSGRPALGYLSTDYQFVLSSGIRNLINGISAGGIDALLYAPISSPHGCLALLLDILNPDTCLLKTYGLTEFDTFINIYEYCTGALPDKEVAPPENDQHDLEPMFEPFSLLAINCILQRLMDRQSVTQWFHHMLRDPEGARHDLFNACASLLKVHSGFFDIKASESFVEAGTFSRYQQWPQEVFKTTDATGKPREDGTITFSGSAYSLKGLFSGHTDSILFRSLFSGNLSDLMTICFGVSASGTYVGFGNEFQFEKDGSVTKFASKYTVWTDDIKACIAKALPLIISVDSDYVPDLNNPKTADLFNRSLPNGFTKYFIEHSVFLTTLSKSGVMFTDAAIDLIRTVYTGVEPFPDVDAKDYVYSRARIASQPNSGLRYSGTVNSYVLLAPCVLSKAGQPEDDFTHAKFRISVQELLALHSHGGLKTEYEMRPIVCSKPMEISDSGNIRAPDFSYINALNCVSDISFARVDAHTAVRGSLSMMAVRWDRFKRVLHSLKVGQNLLCDDYSNAFFYVKNPAADACAGELLALRQITK